MQCVPHDLIIPDDCGCPCKSQAKKAALHQPAIAVSAAGLQALAPGWKVIRSRTKRSSFCHAERSRIISEFLSRAITARDFSTSFEMTESWMTHGIREEHVALRCRSDATYCRD